MGRENAHLEIEFALEYQSLSAADVVYALDSVATELGLHADDYSEAWQVRRAEQEDKLGLTGRVFVEVSGGSIANHLHDLLVISSADTELAKHMRLVEMLIPHLDVKQAFIHHREYRYWQNASDILEYEAGQRDHCSLPKVSNGLPPPLNQQIIDTSRNPGRYRLRDGFRESVASPMWIRPDMILNRSVLSSILGIRFAETNGLLRIETDFMPFTSDIGQQGELQNSLREALYPL